ncbi:hypothetical protein Tco_0038467 [Tanacetum coccineum]
MAVAMKHMALNFVKLEKFKGVDFKRWKKNMHFLLSNMSVVYVLTTLMPEDGGDNPTVDQDTLEAKYMVEDASSKKFLVSNFTKYKMTDSRPVLEQYNELLGGIYLVELDSHLRIEESFRAQDNDKPKGNNVDGPSVINMKCGKPGHLKKDCKADNVGNKANGSGTKGLRDGSSNSLKGATVHVCIDRCWFKTYESLNDGSILHIGNKSTALVHGRGYVDLRFSSGKVVSLLNVLHVPNIRENLVSSGVLNNCGYKQDEALDKFNVYKTEVELQQGSLIKRFRTDRGGLSQGFRGEAMVWGCRAVVRLPDSKQKTLGERGIECIFVRYVEHSNAFRFYVIEPNESVAVNSIIESRDAIFDENRFSSVPRPSQKSLVKGTENSGGLVVPEKVTKEDDLKTFDEAMKSHDVAF